jgi:hypothetical protein
MRGAVFFLLEMRNIKDFKELFDMKKHSYYVG